MKKLFVSSLLAVCIFAAGCASQQNPTAADPDQSSPSREVAVTETETPGDAAPSETTETPAETATESENTETAAAETPAAETSAPVAAGSQEELLADLENADGMNGYEEVSGMTPPAATAESVAAGKEAFMARCASCHGEAADGTGPAGATLDPPPRNLVAADDYFYGSKELAIYRTVRFGVADTGMTPWDGIMTEDEMWNVVHYVRTLQK